MKTSQIILTGTLVGTMAFGVVRVGATQSHHPVTLYDSNQGTESSKQNPEVNKITQASNQADKADGKTNARPVPASLTNLGEYAENLYDLAQANKWTKTGAKLTSLQNTAKRLTTEYKDSADADLNKSIAALNQAVAAKNRQATMIYSNQVTLIATKMTVPFQPKVPVEVALLDYYGRELQIWAGTGNTAKLKTTTNEIRKTWDAVRPSIESHRGSVPAQKFDSLVTRLEAAKSSSEYGRIATPMLDEVDNLEKVFN